MPKESPFAGYPQLSVWVLLIMAAALERSTWSSYSSACASYSKFCGMFKVDAPFPPTVSSLMAWLVVTRFVFGLAASSAGTYLAGLKTMCSVAGYSTAAFADPQVKYLMRGLKKTCPKRFRSKPRLPITIWLLAAFVRKLSGSYQDRLIAAVLSTGVHGLLRAAEYVAKDGRYFLARSNVEWSEDKVVLHVRSKTDYFKTGQEVTLWRNGSICCPWTLLKWAFDNAPDKHPGAPVFQNEDGTPFSYKSLNTAVKRLASMCGLDPALFSTLHSAPLSTTQHHSSTTQHHSAPLSTTQHHSAPLSTTQHHSSTTPAPLSTMVQWCWVVLSGAEWC